ncbi:MAG: ribosome biogenesis GTP-binding protein YihA/YsxC [Nitrospinota bacterium]
MRVLSAEFAGSATGPRGFPKGSLPELAFAGRSNVGKSSLINSLLGRRGLAKTSSTPGKTRCLNFFLINRAFFFVDLPGYGYAGVPLPVRARWRAIVEGYLSKRRQLRGVVLLLDIRRGVTEGDERLIAWLSKERLPFLPVATKADKLKGGRRREALLSMEKALAAIPGPSSGSISPLPFSALKGTGRPELWKNIEGLLFRRSQG